MGLVVGVVVGWGWSSDGAGRRMGLVVGWGWSADGAGRRMGLVVGLVVGWGWSSDGAGRRMGLVVVGFPREWSRSNTDEVHALLLQAKDQTVSPVHVHVQGKSQSNRGL